MNIILSHSKDSVLKAIVIHTIGVILVYSFLGHFSIFVLPTEATIKVWDAFWYESIKDYGYSLIPYQKCNLAFFPLFSYLWKALNMSALGISLLNYVCFLCSFYLLFRNKTISTQLALILLSTPSLLFMFLPYTEALFFLFGTFVLLGYKESNLKILLIGILGCGLTRSISIVFIPALIGVFLIDKYELKKLKQLIVIVSVCVFSVAIVVFVQWVQTNELFYFIKVQKFWKRQFEWPNIPFSAISGEQISGIDTISLFIGLLSIILLVQFSYQKFVKKKDCIYSTDRALIFCLIYLSTTLLINVFFSSDLGDGTVLTSLNRHMLATPFGIYLVYWLIARYKVEKIELVYIICCFIVCIVFTRIYYFKSQLLYFFLTILLFTLYKYFKVSDVKIIYLFYICQSLIQITFFNLMLQGYWIG